MIHPKCQLSFKKYNLLHNTTQHNTDWFQNRWIPRGMLLVELLICISVHVQMGLTYNFISSFFFLSVSKFFLSFTSIYYIISLFPSSCLFFLLSFFFLPFMLQSFFLYFCHISFVILWRLLFVTYFLLLLFVFFLIFFPFYIYLPIISFFLSSDTMFLAPHGRPNLRSRLHSCHTQEGGL